MKYRVFEEYENTGAGAATTARKYETIATAAVTSEQFWAPVDGRIMDSKEI